MLLPSGRMDQAAGDEPYLECDERAIVHDERAAQSSRRLMQERATNVAHAVSR